MADRKELEKTKALMGALLRMPPKQHSEMKLGKAQKRKRGHTKKDRASDAKPKTA